MFFTPAVVQCFGHDVAQVVERVIAVYFHEKSTVEKYTLSSAMTTAPMRNPITNDCGSKCVILLRVSTRFRVELQLLCARVSMLEFLWFLGCILAKYWPTDHGS